MLNLCNDRCSLIPLPGRPLNVVIVFKRHVNDIKIQGARPGCVVKNPVPHRKREQLR